MDPQPNPLAESIARSPDLFPQALVPGTGPKSGAVSFIRLTEADYRGASFLDARILDGHSPSRTIPWPVVEQAAAGLPEACDFIFHIGHVGSTLISRLLGGDPRILPLREPAILRTMAQSSGEYAARADVLFKLWSRSFAPGQRSLVKATSFVSEIAPQILARASAPKAIFVSVRAETYLATILGGPNSRQESKMLAASRLARLNARLGREAWNVSELSEGEIIAMSWACEMTALAAALPNARVMPLDFDKFLADPQSLLHAAFARLGVAIADAEIAKILAGPDMRRYSKAPEHAYDIALRNEVLNGARAEHGGEIKRGLKWLESAARDFVQIREALSLANHGWLPESKPD